MCSPIIRLQITQMNDVKYICKKCNFKSSKKNDYNRHLMTAKHKMTTNGLQKNSAAYSCVCGKVYSCRQNLFRHRPKCDILRNQSDFYAFSDDESINSNENLDTGGILNLIQQNKEFKEMLYEQSKQLQDTQQELLRSNEQHLNMQLRFLDAFKEGKTINNTTNNNQKFNLNFFLNTTCKDAMNMSEFIENISIDFKDIENIGKNGYVSGMTDMILSRIRDLDVSKRPLHCTDLKRETMYIKDNNEWSKDTPARGPIQSSKGPSQSSRCPSQSSRGPSQSSEAPLAFQRP